ncbi:MAG: DUF29 family protein [Desulfobacterales bacterium]
MEELLELKAFIQKGQYDDALLLIGEMEEMSRDDKINKIFSYAEILIIHLIKQYAEKRSTRSWDASIRNSAYKINYINKRRKSGGYYLSKPELNEILNDVWPVAVMRASLEAFEGQYDEVQLTKMVDAEQIKAEALRLIIPREQAI